MKIVFMGYTRSPAFRSPEAWIKRLEGYTGILEALAKKHSVISIEQIDYTGIYIHEGVTYQFLNPGGERGIFSHHLHQAVKQCAPDVIIVHSLQFPLQVIQLKLSLGKKVKIFVQNHAEKPGTGVKKYVQRMADRYISGYFFAATLMAEEWIIKKIIRSEKKVYEVMEASSVFTDKPAAVSRAVTGISGDPVFLWVGRLDKNKDPLLTAQSFFVFHRNHPRAKLYMIYTGVELLPALTALCKQQDPKCDAVTIVPGKKHAEMNEWFSSADFIISSSHYEGSGVAVCEAMSCGCIPIVTDIPSFRMMTEQGRCGILYTAGNEASLVSSLEKAFTLNRFEYRARVVRRFQQKLSFDGIAKDIIQAIGAG